MRALRRALLTRLLVCVSVAATLGMVPVPFVLAGTTGRAVAATAPVWAFPSPGTVAASPTTTISIRGMPPDQVGRVTIAGDTTGAHSGSWSADSDGRGASFRPDVPFAAGERVTVRSALDVVGASNGAYTFSVASPSTVARASNRDDDFAPVRPSASVAPTAFVTRPDLRPPPVSVRFATAPAAPGVIAVTPNGAGQSGPLLLDSAGHVVWYHPLADPNLISTDAKIVPYNGQPVLAWWQGQFLFGYGAGEYELVDQHYEPVATVRAGNGFQADLHDMQITPQNTAIVIAYSPVAKDLTSFGGPANGTVLDNVVQEIDIPTGNVLFEWHSLDHVGLDKSIVPPSPDPSFAWDYFHMNAVAVDNDGNLLISGRHTSNVYKVNRTSGALMWTLGNGGDFTPSFPASDWFECQHDVRRRPDGTLSVFDNGGAGSCKTVRPYSRGLVLSVDEVHKSASFVREVRAHPDVDAATQGAFRALPDGHDFVGWGAVGEMSEFDAAGNEILDMTFTGAQSYRAVRGLWDGQPATTPDVVVARDDGVTHAFASWNGATDVASWVLRTGPDAAHLRTVASAPRLDFETVLRGVSLDPVAVIEAHDAGGALLASRTVVVPVVAHNGGYWIAAADGSVHPFGSAAGHGDATLPTGQHAVGVARAAGGGYWVATSTGSVAAVGAPALGSLAGIPVAAPVVGITATPDGAGYWMVGADGGVFAFGDARFFGSMASTPIAAPITGIASAPDGGGYLLVGSDGGVFAFGTARFIGSMSGRPKDAQIVGLATTGDDGGYWLAGADGGVFAFGDARFFGSRVGAPLDGPIVAMAAPEDGAGYWLLGSDGGVFAYGDALFEGSASGIGAPEVALAHT